MNASDKFSFATIGWKSETRRIVLVASTQRSFLKSSDFFDFEFACLEMCSVLK